MKKYSSLFFVLFGLILSCTSNDEVTNNKLFLVNNFNISIDENPNVGESIGYIDANANYGTLTFYIINQSENNALEINSSTGELKILDNSLFDFEKNTSITAVIKVQNEENFKTVNVVININDVFESRVFKKITETPLEYVVEIFVLRNEITESCETISDDSFTSFNYGNTWFTYHQVIDSNISSYSHDPLNNNNYYSTLPTYSLGGINYSLNGNSSNTYESSNEGQALYNGDIYVGYNAILPITTISVANLLKKENSQTDYILYRKLILKKKFNNNSPLPTNLWVSLNTGSASVYENSIETLRVEAQWWAKFNGNTWEEQNVNVFGNQIESIPSICN